MKKILILSFYFEPDLSAGSFRCTSLVKALLEHQNCQLDVITTLPNRYISFSVNALEYEEEKNCKIQRIKIPAHKSGMRDQIRAYITYYREVKKRVKNKDYDLIFVTSGRLFSAFLGAQLSRKTKAPLYLDIRDIFVDTIADILPKKIAPFVIPLCRLIEQYTFSTAKHINLVSEGFLPYFKAYTHIRYSIYTNGIDTEFLNFPPATTQLKNQLPRVLYAGNIGEGQGLHTIIPALAKTCPHLEFIIIGDGGRKNILAQSVNGLSNVTISPPLDRNALINAYKNADILFLHLNTQQAFEKVLPSKIFEYAATGKPIWAGVSGYAATFLEKEVPNTAVFKPGSIEEAAKSLQTLSLAHTERQTFITKYTRQNIMSAMAADIVSTIGKKQ